MLTLDEFKDRATIPAEYVDEIETLRPGWYAAQAGVVYAWIFARLSKRYAVPFADPEPEIVKKWATDLLTERVWIRRGVDPSTADMQAASEAVAETRGEIKEAADAETGLFDLPLRADTTTSGISKGGPFGYSEQSPYVWYDVQATAARDEDTSGSGT